MAYQEVACTDLDQVPGLIASFAVAQGWTATADGAAQVLRRPVGVGAPGAAVPIRVQTFKVLTGAALARYESVLVSLQGSSWAPATSALGARLRSPKLSSGGEFARSPAPTKLHCFGAGLPTPFLHFVVEYGFNSYRQLYIGTLERPDEMGTAEAVSASAGIMTRYNYEFPAGDLDWRGLFSGQYPTTQEVQDIRNGGVFLPGEAQMRPFTFVTSASNPDVSNMTGALFGGPKDGVDDLLLSHGFSPFSGDNILTPINLYVVTGSGVSARARPIGSVRGVRSVNMRNLEPGSSHVVGNRKWRAFPQLSKDLDRFTYAGPRYVAGNGSYNGWPVKESSFLYGLAALEGNA